MSILLTILGTVAGTVAGSSCSIFTNATSSQAVNKILTQVGSIASQELINQGAKKLSKKK